MASSLEVSLVVSKLMLDLTHPGRLPTFQFLASFSDGVIVRVLNGKVFRVRNGSGRTEICAARQRQLPAKWARIWLVKILTFDWPIGPTSIGFYTWSWLDEFIDHRSTSPNLESIHTSLILLSEVKKSARVNKHSILKLNTPSDQGQAEKFRGPFKRKDSKSDRS